MHSLRNSGKWIAAAFVLALVGCGSEFRTTPVAGQILFEGKPLIGGGTIRFIPIGEGPQSGKAAVGEVTPTGSFELTTYQPKDGAIIGEHRIEIIQKTVLSEAVYDGEKDSKRLVKRPERLPQSEQIPEIYAGRNSPLRIIVEQSSDPMVIELNREGV